MIYPVTGLEQVKDLQMVVFFISHNGACPVNLLRQDEPYELMRKYEFRKAPRKICPLLYRRTYAICTADKKNKHFYTFIRTLMQKIGQVLTGKLLARFF